MTHTSCPSFEKERRKDISVVFHQKSTTCAWKNYTLHRKTPKFSTFGNATASAHSGQCF